MSSGSDGSPEKDLGDVLRNVGRRSEPPDDVVRSVRAAVEGQWRETVAQRARRRRIGLSLAAAVAVAGLGLWLARASLLGPGERMAEVRVAVGSVEAKAGWLRGWAAVGSGQALYTGEAVATSGNGHAALTLADGVSLRLDVDTQITLLDEGRISISRGALYVDSGPDDESPGLLVETPAGAVHHLGTQYETRVLGASEVRIAVREGKVELETSSGAMHRAEAGEQITVSSAGTVVRSAISPYDARWQWVVTTAPPFDIDGRSVADFLAWAARELGRDIVYADAATQAEADRVRLSGSVAGLSPDAALAAVLPTTPLRCEMRSGQLLVSLASSGRGSF
jgi:hypothetical protein